MSKVGILKQDGDRIVLHETFNQAPKLNTCICKSIAKEVNVDFEVIASGSIVTALNSNGGFLMTTSCGVGARGVVTPHLDTGQSLWATIQWLAEKEIAINAHFVTGASVADTVIGMGFKKTNTFVTTVDEEQAWFRYEDSVNSGKWQAITSSNVMATNCTATGDNAGDTGVTVAANTEYVLTIVLDASKIARFFINHEFVYEAPCPLRSTIKLIPYMGVQSDTATADGKKIIRPIALTCSRDM